MSLFNCEKCGVVENTALCWYWTRGTGPALCSMCDPAIGVWHGSFPREITPVEKRDRPDCAAPTSSPDVPPDGEP